MKVVPLPYSRAEKLAIAPPLRPGGLDPICDQRVILAGMHHPSLETYQYKSLPFQSAALTEDQLNQMGAQGWLLVSVLPNIVFAKRISGSPAGTRFDDPMLLSIKQVSERLNMSRTKVYGLIAAGTIASIKVGRLVRIPRQEAESKTCAGILHHVLLTGRTASTPG